MLRTSSPLIGALGVMKSCPSYALILLAVASFRAAADEATVWNPVLKFSLEGGPYKETLIWLSGFSYALSGQFAGLQAGQLLGECRFTGASFSSKELVEILNSRYEGQTITSEQATATLIKEIIPRHILCPHSEHAGQPD